MEKPTGSFLEDTIAVSDTIWISVQNWHGRIFLRALLRSRVGKMHREPEVPEAEVPVEECFDCLARISLEKRSQLLSVKSGILQSDCSASRKMDAGLGKKCSHAHRQVDEQPNKSSKKEWWQKCSGSAEMYSTIRLRISGYGAKVFAEELKHTETNPMCKIHQSRRTSCWQSRPKSFARIYLPRWSSSAWPQCSKIWGSVSGRDGMTRARCPRSSVEAG